MKFGWFNLIVAGSLALFFIDYGNRLKAVRDDGEDLRATVVGRTPEGFHRADARELMNALCAMNAQVSCPDPYKLPNYYLLIERETER